MIHDAAMFTFKVHQFVYASKYIEWKIKVSSKDIYSI